jgi:hypothetical protein
MLLAEGAKEQRTQRKFLLTGVGVGRHEADVNEDFAEASPSAIWQRHVAIFDQS